LGIDHVVARGVGAREFSLPSLGAALAPAGVAVEAVSCDRVLGFFGDRDDVLAADFIVVKERQLLRPACVEEVVVFGGRPRCVFTGPGISFLCTKSRRSARRCAASAR
jgi:hypothetical protein